MTTTYTDAQIEVVAAKLADGISIEHGRPSPLKMGADMLRSLLAERQAAMQGQGGEETTPEIFPGTHTSLSALSIQSKDKKS